MVDYNYLGGEIRKELIATVDAASASPGLVQENFSRFKEAILTAGFHTECNTIAMSNIFFGPVQSGERRKTAIALAKVNAALSDLIYELEDSPIPETIAAQFPAMTEELWTSAMRAIYMTLSAFEVNNHHCPEE